MEFIEIAIRMIGNRVKDAVIWPKFLAEYVLLKSLLPKNEIKKMHANRRKNVLIPVLAYIVEDKAISKLAISDMDFISGRSGEIIEIIIM